MPSMPLATPCFTCLMDGKLDNEIFIFRPVDTKCEWLTVNGTDRLFTVTNGRSQKIDRPVLLLPPFGLSLVNLIIPAIGLASAGCRVMRFDGRNNSGLSE